MLHGISTPPGARNRSRASIIAVRPLRLQPERVVNVTDDRVHALRQDEGSGAVVDELDAIEEAVPRREQTSELQ